jgi:hypothetical protein
MYSIVPLLALLPATYGAAVSFHPLTALSIPNPPYVRKPLDQAQAPQHQAIELTYTGCNLVEAYPIRHLPVRCRK